MMSNRSAPSQIDPDLLADLNYEGQFVQSISTNRRQVKIEKGHVWRVRFLPAELGPKKTFYARIAKHWFNMKPIECPRQTAPAFGGDPEAYCPVCDTAAHLNESANQAESDLGYDVKSQPQWLLYCVVFEKDGVEQTMAEVVQPYEFWMYKNLWEEYKAFHMAGAAKSPLSVQDYKLGNDFVVSRPLKGMKLDKQDSLPIFDLKEPKYAEWLRKIKEGCKNPRAKMPKDNELDDFAAKIEDQVAKLAGHNTARRGRAAVGLEEDDDTAFTEEPEAPRRPTRREAPVEAEAPAEEEDQVPGAEMPSKPAARGVTSRPVASTKAPVRKPAPEPEPETEPEEEAEAPTRPVARTATKAPARKPAPEPEPEPETEAEEETPAPAPTRRGVPAPVAKAPARRLPPAPEPEAEDDNLPPDESTDQAPAAPLEGEGDEAPTPPPAITKRAALGASIASKIQSADKGRRV